MGLWLVFWWWFSWWLVFRRWFLNRGLVLRRWFMNWGMLGVVSKRRGGENHQSQQQH
ncbi:unnamed protein product, partial [Vitis vinifera]